MFAFVVRYDTIRYIEVGWRDGPLNLAYGTETKNKEKLQTKTE